VEFSEIGSWGRKRVMRQNLNDSEDIDVFAWISQFDGMVSKKKQR
jgi:hypothetical protein